MNERNDHSMRERLSERPEPGLLKFPAWAALLVILLVFGLRVHLVLIRHIDPDELEHLHAAFSIFKGQLPGRDFFQHHPPLFYYLTAPLFVFGVSVNMIFLGRFISQVLTALILWSTYRLGNRIFNRVTALLAVSWLSLVHLFTWRTIEVRPDLFALLLVMTTLHLLLTDIKKGGALYPLTGGLAMGCALLCTQKVLFPLLGMYLALLLSAGFGLRLIDRLKTIAIFTIGLTLPLLATAIFFAAHGALSAVIGNTVIAVMNWKRRVRPFHLQTLIFFNPFFAVWGVAGLLGSVKGALSRPGRLLGSHLPLLVTAVTIAGCWIITVSLPEYYLLFLPLLSLYAAVALIDFGERFFPSGVPARAGGAVIFLLTGITIPLVLRYAAGYRFELPLGNYYIGLALILIFWLVGFLLFLRRGLRARKIALILFALAIFSRPVWILSHYHLSDNRVQLGGFRHLMAITRPEERVLDGWTGLSAFRPHAYYYYYLHEGVLLWLGEKEKGEDLLAALRENPPGLVIAGPYLESLSPAVRDYIEANYCPVAPGHPFLARTER